MSLSIDGDEATEILEEIHEIHREIVEASLDFDRKNEAARTAKKQVETLQAKLIDFIQQSKAPMPLFDRDEDDDPPPIPRSKPPSPLDEPIEALGLSPRIEQALRDAGLTTIARLGAWSNSGRDLAEIKGVGKSAAEKIRNALDRFWETGKGVIA